MHVRGRVAGDPEERRRRTQRENYDRFAPNAKVKNKTADYFFFFAFISRPFSINNSKIL